MTNSEKLIARIRALGVQLPDDVQVRRVYPSAASRNAGAWSWSLCSDQHPYDLKIGSQYAVARLVRAGVAIEISAPDRTGDRHIDPVETAGGPA